MNENVTIYRLILTCNFIYNLIILKGLNDTSRLRA